MQCVFTFIIPFCVENRLLVRGSLLLNVFIVTTLSSLPSSFFISLLLPRCLLPSYVLIGNAVSFPLLSNIYRFSLIFLSISLTSNIICHLSSSITLLPHLPLFSRLFSRLPLKLFLFVTPPPLLLNHMPIPNLTLYFLHHNTLPYKFEVILVSYCYSTFFFQHFQVRYPSFHCTTA